MNFKFNQTAKRLISGFVAAATAITMLPAIPAMAEDLGRYPYTLFAGSSAEGAITTTASNFGVNGNVATNGTISAAGNMNINGTKTENAGLDMIYIFDKIDSKYFSGDNVEEHTEDYVLDELNINISEPTEILGEAELTGNININTALKAFKDVTLNGEVKNTNDSVIYSKYGDIVIDSTNVNLNGLVYAPFGSVEVKAMNLNLNNVVIIADSIVFDCPNVNANYSTNAADFVGTVSEPLNIPKDEWQYMKDENENGLPDFFKNFENWSKLADTDGDGLDDGDEIALGTNPLVQDTDGDGTIDSKEKIQQTFTHKVKNEDCAVTEVIVDMECTGNINKTTSVESVMNVDMLCTDVVGLVGEPFEIEIISEFDKATLIFKIDKDKLGDIPFDNLLFLWYNEEDNEFVELETMLDEANGSASIVTTHFSKYMVVDKKAWFDAWAEELNYNPTGGAPSIPVKYNTVLAIDCSGSMDWNAHITRILNIRKCQRIDAAEGYIDYMHASDETAIVFFSSSARVASAMTSDKEALKKALQGLSDNGGTSFSAALRIAARQIDSAEKITNGANKNRIILLSDGDDNDSASARNAAVKVCKEKNIEVYTVGFGSANDSILQNIADETGGKYYRAYDAKDIVDIFAEIGYMDDFDMTNTDGDGLPDAVEAAGIRLQNGKILHGCDPTNPDTDGDGLLDGEEIDPKPFYSQKEDNGFLGLDKLFGTNTVQGYYFKMYSNPTSDNTDSDYDGIEDAREDAYKRLNNQFFVTWKTKIEWDDVQCENISYTMDYSQFFNDNTEYNGKISTVSSLMAGLAYNGESLVGEPDTTDYNGYVDEFLRKHGMKDVKTYQLAYRYDDQHITDVTFGHRRVKYNGQIKEIIAVVVRGTQVDSVEEWSSNFDIGCDSIFEGNGLIPRNEDWEIKENHMGFDIAATRVIKLLDEYLSQAENLDQSAKKTLWITGHSRGAAISNIVGSRLDSKYETFVYTFATPGTTTVSEEIAKSHKSIFNIINSDDIIPDMPLAFWGFRHYGNDIPISVVDNHSEKWKSYTTLSYDSNQKKKEELLNSFITLADDRNDCYVFHCSCHGDGAVGGESTIIGSSSIEYGKSYCIIGSRSEWHGNNEVTYYTRCEATAYFMQYLAYLSAKNSQGKKVIFMNHASTEGAKAFMIEVPSKYKDTKGAFKKYSNCIWDPHVPISYYVLSIYV